MENMDIVFDGPPGPVPGRFVEVENEDGASISRGEWIERDDGYWVLRLPDCTAEIERLKSALEKIAGASGYPADYKWFDEWGDPVEGDPSNAGDMREFGYKRGVWAQAKLARAALEGSE